MQTNMPIAEMSKQKKNAPNPWQQYWDHDCIWFDSALTYLNFEILCQTLPLLHQFSGSEKVLTLGCGAGYLEKWLAPQVHQILALDTSDKALELCQKKCQAYNNVEVRKLSENYTTISQTDFRFDFLICVSVIQYYKNEHEISSLIQSAKKIAQRGARMLIADIPIKQNGLEFALSIFEGLIEIIRRGYFLGFCQTMAQLFMPGNAYQMLRNRKKELQFTIASLNHLFTALDLSYEILHFPVSLHFKRPSILIQF